MNAREKAMSRIRDLMRKAESTESVHESETCVALAQNLMEKYRIEQSAVDLDEGSAEHVGDEPIENFGDKSAPLETKYWAWRGRLAVSLSDFYACRIFKTSRKGSFGDLQVIGRASDVETLRYMYSFVRNEIERLAKIEGRGCGFTWRNNFKTGAVEGYIAKCREARLAARDEMRRDAAKASNNALVRIDSAIMRADDRMREVNAWVDQNMRLRSRSASRSRYDGGARAAGRAAGRTISRKSGAGLPAGRKSLGSG